MIEAHFHHQTHEGIEERRRRKKKRQSRDGSMRLLASSLSLSLSLSAYIHREYMADDSEFTRWLRRRTSGDGSVAAAALRARAFCSCVRVCTAHAKVVPVDSFYIFFPFSWLFFVLFLFYSFYRVAPRGVIDSRPRSIDYDYQGRVGVIRDLLGGSDRGTAV